MKNRKVVLRTCVVTKERLTKNELLRIVRTPEGNVVVDLTGKLNGRGAYIKKDMKVLEKAKKTNILSRNLEVNVSDEIYDLIKEQIDK